MEGRKEEEEDLLFSFNSSPSQLVVLGYFLRDEAKRGTKGEMEQLPLGSLRRTQTHPCARGRIHVHTLEPMGGEERSHIRAQPCLIMDLMETVSAQSVSTCAAPDSSQLASLFFIFFFMCIQYSHTSTLGTRTHKPAPHAYKQ